MNAVAQRIERRGGCLQLAFIVDLKANRLLTRIALEIAQGVGAIVGPQVE